MVTLDRLFDYAVPASWHSDGRAGRLQVGSMVRIDLGGRRVRAWVTEMGVTPESGVPLRELSALTGLGPPKDMIDLARWAAWRWAGSEVSMLRTASPQRRITALPRKPGSRSGNGPPKREHFDDLFEQAGAVTTLRLPPTDHGMGVVLAAARRGDALIVVPGMGAARRIGEALRRAGVRVALGFDDWATAAAGGATVVGARTSVWLPMPALAAVVVIDEHDESLQSEKAPTWHARDVALERARRAGAPAVLVSPIPSLEALDAGTLRTLSRADERAGWPAVTVCDRRHEDPTRGGLFAPDLRRYLDSAEHPGRVVAVLNRTGRSRLMACKACGELVRTRNGRTPMILVEDELSSPDGAERRPVVCASCGSTVLRNLRMGVSRAREDLSALAGGEPVGEVTASTSTLPTERIVIGTEAVLWRLRQAEVVVFLDFDQELLAPRQRTAPQALALLARAARLLGGRRGDSGGDRVGRVGRLVVQTRQPLHHVLQAAIRGAPQEVSNLERERRRRIGLPPYCAQARVSGPGADSFVAALRELSPQASVPPANSVSPANPVSPAPAASPTNPADEAAGVPVTAARLAPGVVTVLGPLQGRYLLRAIDHEVLLDALARTPRGSERVRVEVDPLRV